MPAILHAAKYRDNRNRLGMSFESVAPELAQIAETISRGGCGLREWNHPDCSGFASPSDGSA